MGEQYETLNINMAMTFCCHDCGAVVHNTAKHDDWHRRINMDSRASH